MVESAMRRKRATLPPASRPMPPLSTAGSVDLPRFIGTWHVIAHVPYFFEKGKVAKGIDRSALQRVLQVPPVGAVP